jgi:hypothetical protein
MFSVTRSRLALLLPLALAACSVASSESDAGSAGDAGIIPVSCGATSDCVVVGLDADTCVYRIAKGCASIGKCQSLQLPKETASCTPSQAICPCSGDTQTIPPCWPKGLSPYAVSKVGECSLDGAP